MVGAAIAVILSFYRRLYLCYVYKGDIKSTKINITKDIITPSNKKDDEDEEEDDPIVGAYDFLEGF